MGTPLAVRREITRRGRVRGMFAAAADTAGVIARRAGAAGALVQVAASPRLCA
jgi:hypothetical protein